MRKLLLIFSVLIFLVSCKDKDKIPKGVLPEKKMQAVMWDMIRAGEFLNGFVLNKDTLMDKAAESQKWYNKIYQIHRITKSDFDKSYAWYQDHPLLMKVILDSLSKKQVWERKPAQITVSADSVNRKDTPVTRGPNKRIFDSLGRKRILKKKFTAK